MAAGRTHRKALRKAGRWTGVAIATILATVTSTALLVPAVRASPANVTVSLAGSQPGTVAAGDTITYTLTVASSGTSDSGPVTIVDSMPTDTTYVTGTASCGSVPGCSVVANQPSFTCPQTSGSTCVTPPPTITWTLSSVAAGGSGLALTAEVGIDAGEPGPLVNSATWTGGGCSVSSGCPTNQVSNSVMDVMVTLSSAPATGARVKAGDIIDLTVAVSNDGTGPTAVPLQVFDDNAGYNVPPPWNYVEGSASCGSVPGCTVTIGPAGCQLPVTQCLGNDIDWILASVPAQTTSFDLTYSLQVASTASGSIAAALQWGPSSGEGSPAFFPGVYVTSCPSGGTCSPSEIGAYTGGSNGDGCLFVIAPETVECQSNGVSFSVSPSPLPIPHVTSIPTGEPWAGAGPYEIALGGIGLALIAIGRQRKRRVIRP